MGQLFQFASFFCTHIDLHDFKRKRLANYH
jgi:hypothetical protein